MKQLLKILSLSFLVIMIASSVALAQEDEDDNPLTDDYETYKEGFNIKERIFTGGTIGFGYSGSILNFSLSPFVGVRLTDHLHVATGINYGYEGFRNGTYKENLNILDYRLFTRYLLLNFETIGRNIKREPGDPLGGLYVHVEYATNVLAKFRQGNNPPQNFSDQLKDKFYVGAGYQQNFYRGFGYFMEIVYDVLQEDTQFSGWPIDIRAGLYFGF